MFKLFSKDEVKRTPNKTFELNGREYSYAISNDNVHIVDSYTISKADFDAVLKLLRARHQNCQVWLRTNKSLRREWATHNLCYAWNIKRAQTADVDLNTPQTFWEKVGYGIVGWFALMIID